MKYQPSYWDYLNRKDIKSLNINDTLLNDELLIFLPTLAWDDIREMASYLKLNLNDEDLIEKIATYIVNKWFDFDNKKIAWLLNDYELFLLQLEDEIL